MKASDEVLRHPYIVCELYAMYIITVTSSHRTDSDWTTAAVGTTFLFI